MKQKDGRYRKKITVGTKADGTKIVKYASGKTKKELEQNADEIRKTYVGGEQVKRDVMYGDYLIQWFRAYKLPRIGESSRQSYQAVINRHILPYLGDRRVSAITAADLQETVNRLTGYGQTTIGYALTVLRGTMRRAYADGLTDRDPTVGLIRPSAVKHSRRALTEQETAAALKVGHEHPEGLLILLLYYTGMRVGEAIGLRWTDIDFRAKKIRIERDADYAIRDIGEVKTPASRRTVPLPDELAEVLQEHRGIGYVIAAPQTTGFLPQPTLRRRWKRLMTAMYEADPTIESRDGMSVLTPHYFRHNYASVLYNAGVDLLTAQKFLGHADVKTTLTVYTHLAKNAEDSGAEMVLSVFSGEKKVAKKLPEHQKQQPGTKRRT